MLGSGGEVICSVRAAVFGLTLALGLGSTPDAAAQTAPSNAVIIVDGSNSMWAQIAGTAKIALANQAIADVLGRRPNDLIAGVIAYGGNTPNSCSDVETVVPLARFDGNAVTTGLGTIRPQGATPIAAALEAAADTLPEGPATIALIADGRDNCSGDPCAVAAQLATERPGLAVHVIGFSPEAGANETLGPLACISEATGGSFRLANDGASLTVALEAALDAPAPVRTVSIAQGDTDPADSSDDGSEPLDIADVAENGTSFFRRSDNGIPLPPIRPDPSAPDSDGTDAALSDLPPTTDSGATVADEERPRRPVRLWAQLTGEMGALPNDLIWRVFAIDPANPGAYELYETSDEAQPQFLLPEGRYVVHVGYGRAYQTQVIEVGASAIEQEIVLEAGGLRVHQIGANERELPRGQSRLAVYSSEQDEFGQRRLLLRELPPAAVIRLNAGTYHVVSQYGDANSVVRTDVRIQPGLLTDAWISHHAATITLKLVTEIGGEALANTAWSILSPGGDIVKESFGAFPTHVLAAGDYSVIARHEGQLFNRDFTVSAGEVREVELLAE